MPNMHFNVFTWRIPRDSNRRVYRSMPCTTINEILKPIAKFSECGNCIYFNNKKTICRFNSHPRPDEFPTFRNCQQKMEKNNNWKINEYEIYDFIDYLVTKVLPKSTRLLNSYYERHVKLKIQFLNVFSILDLERQIVSAMYFINKTIDLIQKNKKYVKIYLRKKLIKVYNFSRNQNDD